MANTSKSMSQADPGQTLKYAFNDVDGSLTTNGFLTGLVGRKITRVDTNAMYLTGVQVGDDFSFYEGATLLYTLRIIYDDSTKASLYSAERVA